jgi:hypothetical protein
MSVVANSLRGEAQIKIGSVETKIAIEFSRLVALSKALQVSSLDELYRRLLGFEPWAVACGLRCLIIDEGGAKEEAAIAAKAIAELTAADEGSWQRAINAAMLGHIEAGRRLRNEKPLAGQVEDAVLGEQDSPS